MKNIFLAMSLLVLCGGSSAQIANTLFDANFRLAASTWCPVDGNSTNAKIYGYRAWDWWATFPTGGIKWNDLQPSNSAPTFTNLDTVVVTDAGNTSCVGSAMKVIYTFGGMPPWASICGSGAADPGPCLPGTGGGYGGGLQCKSTPTGANDWACTPPADVATDGTGNDAYYGSIVAAVATRYSGKINYYEPWNEADSPGFWCESNGTVVPPGSTCGSGNPYTTANVEPLNRLIRMAWDLKQIVHCIDPSAKVLSPSFHVDTALTWFHFFNITTINAPAGVSGVNGVPIGCSWPAQTVSGKMTYDYVNLHARGTSAASPNPAGNWNPESIVIAYNNTVAEIAADGLPNPGTIFNDEFGYNSTTEGGGNTASYQAYVARQFIWCASLPFARCDWYQWDSQFGAGLAGTAVGAAYDVVVGWLNGGTITTSCGNVSTLYTCGLSNAGKNFIIAWDSSTTCNPSCTTNNYNFGAAYTTYFDLSNAAHPTTGTAGTAPVGWQPILLQSSLPTTNSAHPRELMPGVQ